MKKHLFLAAVLLVLLCGCTLQQEGEASSSSQATTPSQTVSSTTPSTLPTQGSVATQPSTTPTQPSTATTQPSTATTQPVTTPTATTVPAQTTVSTQPSAAPTETLTIPTHTAVTTPTQSPDGFIGTLYTRAQLDAMDNSHLGCPSGTNAPANTRPGYSIELDARYKKYDAHFIGPDEEKIYLTFTLGYEHNNLTASILDTLKEKNVKGIFIINMHYARSCPDLVRRMIDEGHIVGNHSANHYTLSDLSTDRVAAEIMNLHNYVLENYNYEMTYFRPPSGYFSERVLAIAQSLGYTTLQYSFAYVDWEVNNQPDPTSAFQKMINSLYNGTIYQFHTVSSTNAQVLGAFIDAAREKGLELSLFD